MSTNYNIHPDILHSNTSQIADYTKLMIFYLDVQFVQFASVKFIENQRGLCVVLHCDMCQFEPKLSTTNH